MTSAIASSRWYPHWLTYLLTYLPTFTRRSPIATYLLDLLAYSLQEISNHYSGPIDVTLIERWVDGSSSPSSPAPTPTPSPTPTPTPSPQRTQIRWIAGQQHSDRMQVTSSLPSHALASLEAKDLLATYDVDGKVRWPNVGLCSMYYICACTCTCV